MIIEWMYTELMERGEGVTLVIQGQVRWLYTSEITFRAAGLDCYGYVRVAGLEPLQSTPVPVSYTKYVTKHMSKIEMGES